MQKMLLLLIVGLFIALLSGDIEAQPVESKAICLTSCNDDYHSCQSEVESKEECISKFINGCTDTCLNQFHHSSAQCQSYYCSPSNPQNKSFWEPTCRDERKDALDECQSKKNECFDNCNQY